MKKLAFLLSLLFVSYLAKAQQPDSTFVEINTPFEIGGIRVSGNTHSDAAGIIAISGLNVGQIVSENSMAIPNAIKALWRLELFADVQIFQTKTIGNVVFLEIAVQELPRLLSFQLKGIKKREAESLKEQLQSVFLPGTSLKATDRDYALQLITDFYSEKGYPDVQIEFREQATQRQQFILLINIDKGERVKVATIEFKGNTAVSDRKLKKLLDINTRSKWFAKSLLTDELLEAGKAAIKSHYASLGHLDMTFVKYHTTRNADDHWTLQLEVVEGSVYKLGKIDWKGNSIYSDHFLNTILDMKTGDVFNQQALNEGLRFRPDDVDVSALYLDHGYLFFNMDVQQKAIRQDTIDLEIRIQEGPQATIGQVHIEGNERTNEAVIRRELRTQPGETFSRQAIIRSQRALMNLGYFNPQTMDVRTEVNPQEGTVDLTYVLEEKINDQFELSAGWGGGDIGITGTVGISLNNFSIQNLFKKSAWRPYPSGDGQRLSFRVQSNGAAYQSYNVSFTEPWLSRHKPSQLSVGTFYNHLFDEGDAEIADGHFSVLGLNASLGTRFEWGHQTWVSTTGLSYQGYQLSDWNNGFFTTLDGQSIENGQYHNLAFSQKLSLNTTDHPLFPTRGIQLNASVKATLPYAAFGLVDAQADSPQEQFRWLEYHKWQVDAAVYQRLAGKLVLKGSAKLGFVGHYSKAIGTSPFERYQLGGDGFSNAQNIYTGTDLVSLRGYGVEELENNYQDGALTAQPLFAKYTAELRYPISFNPNATIWATAFAEAGNSWSSLEQLQVFKLKKSVGLGLRVHLPMFGTLGFDYGIGFDKPGPLSLQNNGRFNIILGFEPF